MKATEQAQQRKNNVKIGISMECRRWGKVTKSQKFITPKIFHSITVL